MPNNSTVRGLGGVAISIDVNGNEYNIEEMKESSLADLEDETLVDSDTGEILYDNEPESEIDNQNILSKDIKNHIEDDKLIDDKIKSTIDNIYKKSNKEDVSDFEISDKKLKKHKNIFSLIDDNYEDKDNYYLYQTSGLPLIAEREFFLFGKFNKFYYYPNHEHTIVWGGSGSGKTASLVMPLLQSILDAKENAVIHDCKLELFEAYGKKFKDAGYNVIVLNFANPRYSHRWNPFHYPSKLWKDVLDKHNLHPSEFRKVRNDLSRAIEVYKDCAINLCYEEDNDRNSYFWKGAGAMMAGAALLLAEEGRFDCINGKGIQMIYAMDKSNEEKGTVLKEYVSTCRELDDDSTIQINNYLVADAMTRGNIESTFRQKIEILNATPDVSYLTSGTDFELEDIFEKQTVVFILTQDEKDQYYPLVTLFLKQLYEVGVQLTRQGKYKKWIYNMNWVIEEMGILPEIKNFKNIYNAARSRGLTIYGFMQSMADAIDKYEITGTNTILENCRVHVVVHAEQKDTIEYITGRVGKELYWDKTEKKYKERNLLTQSKMSLLEKGRIIFTIAGQKPYIAKLPQYSQCTFYTKPDLKYLYSENMFGPKGREYDINDLHWYDDLRADIGKIRLNKMFENTALRA